ncbi:MAG: PKD domain-containing protein [Flavobacteriales bacterium]|nr:PKD domain-containing protein [Flavobacteriales bacterium]
MKNSIAGYQASVKLDRSGPYLSRLAAMVILAVSCHQFAVAQAPLDDFDRPNNLVVGNGWVETETSAPGSISVENGVLFMKSPSIGRDHASRAFVGGHDPVLGNNQCTLEWAFSMRQTRSNPTGFDPEGWGIAVVLAGSDADPLQGSGYAVVLGTPNSTTNRLRLVRYTGGLSQNSNITNIITTGNFAQQHLDVRVTFDPADGTWSLFYADQGSGPFGNPRNASTPGGTAVDVVHASTPLGHFSCLWNHAIGSQARGVFDNIHVPYACETRLEMVSASASAMETDGSYLIGVRITNPHPTVPTQVSVVRTSGDADRVGGFTTEVLTFPAGNSAVQYVPVQILDDGGCTGNGMINFQLQGASGGSGSPIIGDLSDLQLTIVDPQSTQLSLLDESFETDGAGSRYFLSVPHGVGPGGAYFLRADLGGFAVAGALAPTNMEGTHAIGATRLGPLATNSEITITVPALDIMGMYGVDIGLRVAARSSSNYDNSTADRDHLLVEVNVDGAGWTTVGAFRSTAVIGGNNKRIAQDTDLDGRGDGSPLNTALRNFSIPMSIQGNTMDVRLRLRSTDVLEEIMIDDLRVAGVLCKPTYYSAQSGVSTDPIWSTVRNGVPASAAIDKLASLVVQDGHEVSLQAAQVRDLAVEAGGLLNILSNTVEVFGELLSVDGILTDVQGHLVLEGQSPLAITGAGLINIHDITVDRPAGVLAEAPMALRGTLQLENGVLDNRAGITLLSSATRTARLGPVPVSADLLGNITMQRFVPGGRTNWRMLGSPVQGATIADWNADFYTTGFPGSNYPNFTQGNTLWPSIRWYDEQHSGSDMNDGLTGVSGNEQPLLTGQGFVAWCGDDIQGTQPFVVDVTGPPTIARSPITLPMSYTNTGSAAADGWNLVANPLPSPILFSAISRDADVQNAYWIFNPATGNYATWIAGVGTNGANGAIQSSQAFWLRANGPAVTTTLGEAAKTRTHAGGLFGGLEQQQQAMLRLSISSSINEFSDETVIIFQDGTPTLGDEDAVKLVLAHPQAPQIASRSSDQHELAINRFGSFANDVAIELAVKVAVTGTYTITTTDMEHLNGLSCLVLEDLVTGTITPLHEGATYSFSMAANANAEEPRFMLRATAPIPFTFSSAACFGAGGSAQLDVPAGAYGITWSSSAGEVLFSDVTTVEELPAGNYQVSVSGTGSACGQLVQSFTIAEPFAMEVYVEAGMPSCHDASDATLALEVLGGVAPYTYLWSNGATTATLQNVGAGSYVVTVTDANGCTLQPGALVVNAPAPLGGEIVEPEATVVGQAVFFVSTAPASSEHSWDFGDGNTSSDWAPVHSYDLPGTYVVTLTLRDGECQRSLQTTISVSVSTGLNELDADEVRAYSNGEALVLLSNLGQELHVQVYDAAGRMKTVKRVPAHSNRLEIPTSGWAPGVYFLNASTSWEQWTFTLPVVE